MARGPSQNALLQRLLAQYAPQLRAAFEAALRDLKDGVDYPALIDALRRSDTQAAISAMRIEPAVFNEYLQRTREAYAAGGAQGAAEVSNAAGGRAVVRFDMSDPVTSSWIASQSAEAVTAITEDIRQAVRETTSTGYLMGRHPNSIAIDLVGRRGPTGVREGGVLGLDAQRSRWLAAVTRGMETPDGVRDLVVNGKDGLRVRYKVNAATEKRIIRAYLRGTAVPAKERALSARQYSNALLKARGETIARTETLQAVQGARDKAWREGLGKLGASPSDVVKKWFHGGGPKEPRWHHVDMSGQEVEGLDAPFIFANGARLRYAGDPMGGPEEVINCTCTTTYRLSVAARLRQNTQRENV